MSYVVSGTPPVAEAVACKLTGIETVPKSELPRMANRAAVVAQEVSDAENKRLREALDTILMIDPAAEDAAFLAVTVAGEALQEDRDG